MEILDRVVKLEQDVSAMKTDVAVIRSNYASKEDLHKEMNAQTWKIIIFVAGLGVSLTGVTYFIAKHVG
ncbi:MAG: hypothetical protein ACRYF5_16655 [Janthinobacterium lividum]